MFADGTVRPFVGTMMLMRDWMLNKSNVGNVFIIIIIIIIIIVIVIIIIIIIITFSLIEKDFKIVAKQSLLNSIQMTLKWWQHCSAFSHLFCL